jgi:hypothetical protein
MNVLATKIGALKMGSKTQNDDLLENEPSDFHYISVIYGKYHPK